MSGLLPDEDALLGALREHTCTPEDVDRMRQRLVAMGVHSLTVAAVSGTLVTAQGAKALSPIHAAWKALAGAKLTAASAIVLASVAAVPAVRHALSSPAAAPAVQQASPGARAPVDEVATRPPSDADVSAAARAEPTSPGKPAVRRPSRTRPSALATKPAVDTLQAESALLLRAAESLHAGDPGRAALLLDEHERRYPDGLLQAERELARTRLK